MSSGRKLAPAAIAGVVVLAVSALAASPPAQPGPGVVADDAAYRVVLPDTRAMPDRIGEVLTEARCVLANDFVHDRGAISVGGYAGRDAATALHRRLAGIVGAELLDWHVRPVDPVFCDALTVLRPVSALAGAPIAGLVVKLDRGVTTLRDGQRIKLRVTMGDFAGEVRVDYLVHDGSVMHLYPTAADLSQNMVAQPAARLAPGAELSLGEPGPGHPGWEVGPPYGTDMIIAVASTAPLLVRTQARNVDDNAARYLRDLADGIARVRRSGGRIASTLLSIDTVEK